MESWGGRMCIHGGKRKDVLPTKKEGRLHAQMWTVCCHANPLSQCNLLNISSFCVFFWLICRYYVLAPPTSYSSPPLYKASSVDLIIQLQRKVKAHLYVVGYYKSYHCKFFLLCFCHILHQTTLFPLQFLQFSKIVFSPLCFYV